MTLASAERFSLKGIGKLETGYAADIVLFNADTIADTPPDNEQPARKPKGVEAVYINGTLVVEKGDYVIGRKPGLVLKP